MMDHLVIGGTGYERSEPLPDYRLSRIKSNGQVETLDIPFIVWGLFALLANRRDKKVGFIHRVTRDVSDPGVFSDSDAQAIREAFNWGLSCEMGHKLVRQDQKWLWEIVKSAVSQWRELSDFIGREGFELSVVKRQISVDGFEWILQYGVREQVKNTPGFASEQQVFDFYKSKTNG